MAVRAADRVTLAVLPSPSYVRQYYVLQASALAAPALPTANPPAAPWVLAEPSYTPGSTNTLYTVMLTAYGTVAFEYGPVQRSSSYEAAKQAYNLAYNTQTVATALETLTNGWKSPGTNNIDGAVIKADTIVAAQIAALAITSKHTITGAVLRTAASGQRVEINSQGLIGYDSTGTPKTVVGSDGLFAAVDAIISGTTRTAATGARVELGYDPLSGYRGSLKFINDSDVVKASTYMDANERLKLSGPGASITVGADTATSTNFGNQDFSVSMPPTRYNGKQYFTLSDMVELYGPELTMVRRFPTRAALAYASGSGLGYRLLDKAVVYADPTAGNNGDYVYNGTTWLRSPQQSMSPVHAEFTATSAVPANTNWGPGALSKDAALSVGGEAIFSPGNDRITVPPGVYTVSNRAVSTVSNTGFSYLSMQDAGTSVEYSSVDIASGNGAITFILPNFRVANTTTFKFVYRTGAAGTWSTRVRVTQIG